MRDFPTIADLYRERKKAYGPVLSQMVEIRDHYNSDIVIPLPELDQTEKPAVANLLTQGIDQHGMRIASVMPDVFFPPLRPGVGTSEEKARKRRKATLAWWEMTKIKRKMRRRGRWLIAYATSPVVIRPDFQNEIPTWHLRDPLCTFPCPTADPDDMTPYDCIFTFQRSLGWIKQNYPEAANQITAGPNATKDTKFDLLEYIDPEDHVLGVLGQTKDEHWMPEWGTREAIELERIPNRAGICTAVVPGRITLDRRMGQFDSMVGLYQLQAKMMALEVIAVERGIFPDTYLIGRQGEQPNIIAGPFDGRTGKINVVSGGDIKELVSNPTYLAPTIMDRLERAQRLNAGVPAEFGGESPTNVRTGRRGDAVLSAVVDFPIQEAQDLLAESLYEENKRAIAIDKAYFNYPKTFWVSWRGSKGRVEYTPEDIFETDRHTVTYSHPGTDANSLLIGIGQRIGVGTMSKKTAMKLDPLLEDWELEHDTVVAEGIEQALLQGILQQVQGGTMPVSDAARIMELVGEDKMDLAKAILTAQREAQERQASQAPPGAPETMPGLAPPGAGAEAGTTIPEAPASLANLSGLLSNLRRPAMTLPGEAAAGGL